MTTPYPPGAGQLPMYPAGAPQPKKGMSTGKILLLVFGGLALLCCGGGAITVGAGLFGASKTLTATSTAGTSTKGTSTTVGLNQAGRDGKFEFIVTNIKYGVPHVGSDSFGENAQGQFVLVTVTVKNIGDKPQTFDGSSQKAKGVNGAVYEHNGSAEMSANSDTQTFLNGINPGNSVTGVIVFDIPKDAKIASLELHDSPFSGGVTVTVA